MPKKFLARTVLAALLAAVPLRAQAGPAGVELLSAGPGTIRVGVIAPRPELTPPKADTPSASAAVRLELPGWDLDAEPGRPPLPIRIVRVAVPPTGPVDVRAIGLLEETREGVELAIRPDPAAPRGAAPSERGSAAPERARLLGVSWLRNQRVASIGVLPVDYDPATRRLTSYARVELEITVAPVPTVTQRSEEQDPFEAVYAGALPNYEQGKAWRRPAASAIAGGATIEGSVTVPATSLFAGHTWVKIAIPKSGFYKVNFGQLRTLEPFASIPSTDSIAWDRVRLYAWPGRPVLSENTPCDGCDYRQVAISIEDTGNDGRVANNSDAFTFYALGPSDWANHFDPAFPDTVFIRHPYENRNYYYLSFDRPLDGDVAFTEPALRIVPNSLDATPSPSGAETQPASFAERMRIEEDFGAEYYPSVYMASGFPLDGREPWAWEKFFWQTLGYGGTFQQLMRIPAPAPGVPAYVRHRAFGVNPNDPENPAPNECTTFHLPHALDFIVSSPADYDSARAEYSNLFGTTLRVFPALDTLTRFTVRVPTFNCSNRMDQQAIAWFEVYYRRQFVPEANTLFFDSPGQGNVIYHIGPFTTDDLPRIFDITDPFRPVEMKTDSAAVFIATDYLRLEVNETGPRRYAIVPATAITRPAATDFTEASPANAENLRATEHAADYLVIYYDGFKAAADSLVLWRQQRLPLAAHAAPYLTRGVPVSAIYDQFSGGRVDPAAIRDFLRAVFFNWRQGGHEAASYVTLLGDASFDYRNLLGLARSGQPASLLTSFENNIVGQVQYATDDWLLNVDNFATSAIPEFYGARIPASDLASAHDYVQEKLLFYERSAPNGAYTNRVMLIADDDLQGEKYDRLLWAHLAQTAQLDSLHLPRHVDRAYVYLHTYPDGPGRTKPLAKADIKNTINGDGVTIFNFIGHGSPFKISDENVLIDTDAGTFVNATKLPLFVAASCDVGKFNDPRVQSLGERLVFGENGGTIGVISASELAYSSLNVDLANVLYDNLFHRDPATGRFDMSVAQALLLAKLATSGGGDFSIRNNQKYHLLGDAGEKLNLPDLWVEVSLYDETGTTPVTEVRGGQTLLCRGRVLDRQGGSAVAYDGVVDLLIEDSAPKQTSPDCQLAPGCERATYDFKAGAIYRGDLVVTGGSFATRFVVPVEVRGGPRGRVRAYVGALPGRPPQTDGVGSIRMQVSPGTAPEGDQSGPTISLSFPGGVTSVKPDAVLRIELSDPSGILTTGHTVQNGIVVTVDENTTARVDVTSSFRYAAGSYTTGTAFFTLPNLSPGPHTVRVSAADNLAGGLNALVHRSTASITFEVAAAPPIAIRNTYLFPNPTESGRRTSGGQFVVDGPGDSVNVLLRIYTISGRLIRELSSFGSYGQVQIPWDGYDAEGYPLANGTYLFKVYVNGRDDRGRSTATQKAAREGRFVILNH